MEEFVCTLPGVAAAAAAIFLVHFSHVLMSAMSRVAEVLEA
jgi:molybdopterin biosynthesis enzyme